MRTSAAAPLDAHQQAEAASRIAGSILRRRSAKNAEEVATSSTPPVFLSCVKRPKCRAKRTGPSLASSVAAMSLQCPPFPPAGPSPARSSMPACRPARRVSSRSVSWCSTPRHPCEPSGVLPASCAAARSRPPGELPIPEAPLSVMPTICLPQRATQQTPLDPLRPHAWAPGFVPPQRMSSSHCSFLPAGFLRTNLLRARTPRPRVRSRELNKDKYCGREHPRPGGRGAMPRRGERRYHITDARRSRVTDVHRDRHG